MTNRTAVHRSTVAALCTLARTRLAPLSPDQRTEAEALLAGLEAWAAGTAALPARTYFHNRFTSRLCLAVDAERNDGRKAALDAAHRALSTAETVAYNRARLDDAARVLAA